MLGKSFLAGFIRPITGPDPATRDRLRRLGKTLQTGDLVLFAGKGWLSGIIRLFTRSHWTHVGVVVRLRGWSEPMVLEACGMSELVAELYRRVGWLAPEARTSRFVPGDFAGEGAGYGRVCERMASIEVIKSSAAP